jgi:hypothetical protein
MLNEVKGSNPILLPAMRGDCLLLAKTLREEDKVELTHALGLSPEQSLLYSYTASDNSYTAWLGDEIILMFGVGGIPGQYGSPWMLASDLLMSVKMTFIKQCRPYVEALADSYGYLENYVWAGNTGHIRWLKWLGFHICEPEPYGINGEPFHRFFMKR